jgi:hypothetical protein
LAAEFEVAGGLNSGQIFVGGGFCGHRTFLVDMPISGDETEIVKV